MDKHHPHYSCSSLNLTCHTTNHALSMKSYARLIGEKGKPALPAGAIIKNPFEFTYPPAALALSSEEKIYRSVM